MSTKTNDQHYAFSNETIHFKPDHLKYWDRSIDRSQQTIWERIACDAIRFRRLRYQNRLQTIQDEELIEEDEYGETSLDILNRDPYIFGNLKIPSKFWYYTSIEQLDKTSNLRPTNYQQVQDSSFTDYDAILTKQDYFPIIKQLSPEFPCRTAGHVFFDTETRYKKKGSIRIPQKKVPYTITWHTDTPAVKRIKRGPEVTILKTKSQKQERDDYWKERAAFIKKYNEDAYVRNEIINDTFQELMQGQNQDLEFWFNNTTSCVKTRYDIDRDERKKTKQREYHDDYIISSTNQSVVDYANQRHLDIKRAHRVIERNWRLSLIRKIGKTTTFIPNSTQR